MRLTLPVCLRGDYGEIPHKTLKTYNLFDTDEDADFRPSTRKRKTKIQRHKAPKDLPTRIGIVSSISAARCTVISEGEALPCLVRHQRELAIGDMANVSQHHDVWTVDSVQERHNALVRPDPGNRNRLRVLAANIDLAAIVVSWGSPPFHPRVIDRFLVLCGFGGVPCAVVLNKADLISSKADRADANRRLKPYQTIGIPILETSTETGSGLDEFRELLRDKTCVVVGHSGVGKSSLVNSLLDTSLQATSEVSSHARRGRHTTVRSDLLDWGMGKIIDTPGIRTLGTSHIPRGSIRTFYPEFREFAPRCRFVDCLHIDESDCAVRAAVQSGTIPAERYRTYLAFVGADSSEDNDHFECDNCGKVVANDGGGTEHRNHCPHCLHSLHLDTTPGDRTSGCGALMEPISVWVRKGGEWAIIHRCRSCGALRSNRTASDDNEFLLLSLAAKPMAQPPFPLGRATIEAPE